MIHLNMKDDASDEGVYILAVYFHAYFLDKNPCFS